jgi:hypothetical protein
MYLVIIAWLYVTLMMAVAEATSPTGTCWALVTFVLYGLLPMGIVGYILGTPIAQARHAGARMAEQAAQKLAETHSPHGRRPSLTTPVQPDAGGHAPAAAESRCRAGAKRTVRHGCPPCTRRRCCRCHRSA